MAISDFEVPRDYFKCEELSSGNGLSFPCCVCDYRHGTDKEFPCKSCGHNINAEKEVTQNEKDV